MSYVHAAVSMSPPAGVARQMEYEANAATDLGLDWTVWLFREPRHGGRWPRIVRSVLHRVRFYKELVDMARLGKRIVLRYSPGDPFQFLASFFLKSYYTVHHTFEERELASSPRPLAPLLLLLERLLGRSVVARASGIICVTPEIARYEERRAMRRSVNASIIYPNGVLYGNQASDLRQDRPEVLFVASQFVAWHGLDLLIGSMAESHADALLHIVGDVPAALTDAAAADPRIRLHGTLDSDAVDSLISRCWVGLSSFSLATKGMTQACTLKTREYLRAGMPVYAGHRDSALPLDFAYFREGKACWEDILIYARSMRGISRAEVASAAMPYIDKKVLLERLYRHLEARSPTTVFGSGQVE